MKSLLTRLLLAGFFITGAAAVKAQTTINFTSVAFEVGKTSTGTLLDNTYTFALGSFGSFTPSASNVADWAANFTSLGSTTWDGTFTQYSGTGTLNDNNAPFTSSNQGFIWGYNTQAVGPTSEWILISNATWLFPTAGSIPTVDWTSNDVGTFAALGILTNPDGASADPYLQTANLSAVPEPSTYALLAGIASLGFLMARKRFVKA